MNTEALIFSSTFWSAVLTVWGLHVLLCIELIRVGATHGIGRMSQGIANRGAGGGRVSHVGF